MSKTSITKKDIQQLKKEIDADYLIDIKPIEEEVKEYTSEKLNIVFGHQPKKLKKIQSHFNQLVELRKQLDALVDEGLDTDSKEYKEARKDQEEMMLMVQSALLVLEAKTEEEQDFKDRVVMKMMRESKGQIDKYGIPISVWKEKVDDKELDEELKTESEKAIREVFEEHKIYEGVSDEYSREEIDAFIKRMANQTPLLKDIVMKEFGKLFQNPIKGIKNIVKNAVLKSDKYKPLGESDRIEERNEKLRERATELERTGMYNVAYIRKTLSKEFNLAESTIRDILYKV
jgi:hypothetical protein